MRLLATITSNIADKITYKVARYECYEEKQAKSDAKDDLLFEVNRLQAYVKLLKRSIREEEQLKDKCSGFFQK